jgi:hypothetical protein
MQKKIVEYRKHWSQLTRDEITQTLNLIKAQRHFVETPYSSSRVVQRGVPKQYLPALISYGKLIELHYVDGDNRVLIRGRVYGRDVSAVLSLTRNVVITAYVNSITDHHATLDTNIYNWGDKEIV